MKQDKRFIKNVEAEKIEVVHIGNPVSENLQHIHDLTRSAGHLDGGNITNAGGGNIAVSAGKGLIRGIDDDVSTLYYFEWNAVASIAVPNNTVRHVIISYNGGSPLISLIPTDTTDYRTQFVLGFVVNENGTLYINDLPHSSGRGIGRFSRRNYEVDGRSRANQLGGLIISSPAGLTISISAGVTWYRGLRDVFAGMNTNTGSTFDKYYRNGGPWNKLAAQTVIDPASYDDGTGTLGTVSGNQYSSKWFYLGPTGQVIMLYGWAVFSNQASCIDNDTAPASVPLRMQESYILLGRTISRGNDTTVTLIQSAFTSTFTGAVVTNHNDLGGLNLGDYQHLTVLEKTKLQDTSLNVTWMLASGTDATIDVNLTNVIIVPRTGTITKAYIYAKTAPTGADLTIDINKNGTTIWTNQTNRLTLAPTIQSSTQTLFDVTSVVEGDLLTIDVDSIGSTIPGKDITVILKIL